MAPFLETEIMTIKRIEVALRKMDFKLLKDAAYKLHEKLHNGFKFEYVDILKEIKEDILKNEEIPQDIKELIIPTIEDIVLKNSNEETNSLSENKVSSLTSLSFGAVKEENSTSPIQTAEKPQEEKPSIDAFSAFGGSETKTNSQTQTQTSPFKVEPFKEFSTFEQISQIEPLKTAVQQQTFNMPDNQNTSTNEIYNEIVDEPVLKENTQISNIQTPEIKTQTKTVAIYYHLNNSLEKARNITKFRELINKDDTRLKEILNLIKEIKAQSNVNVSELKTILEQLIQKNNKINIITNCSSSDLVNLLNSIKIDFDLFDNSGEKQINLLPVLGLTNFFTCKQCSYKYLEKNSSISPIILQCPHCKGEMYPEIYTINKNSSELNINYYNSALISLASSKVWLIIHPKLKDETEINLLKTALKTNNQTENIFIVDKDINVRENCKKMFLEIKENLNINTQLNVIEEFFNIMS